VFYAHSIYFQVLGEHGFVGLFLFVLLGVFAWRTGAKVIRATKHDPKTKWAADLIAMTQVSLIGYATAGAFLGLAYFDLPYHLIVIIVLAKVVLEREGVSVLRNQRSLSRHPKLHRSRSATVQVSRSSESRL
jgi:O-antigen ligase